MKAASMVEINEPGNGHTSGVPTMASGARLPQRRRSPWPLAILAALFIIVPFLTWYGTWFGRELSDEDIGKYLVDEKSPRHVQHALSQVAERLSRGDRSVRHWYPQVIVLAKSPVTEFRLTVAWVMGQDNGSDEFHQALLALLEDQEPIVRRNAALSLIAFKDARGRGELRAMLQPYQFASPYEGTMDNALSDGSKVQVGTLLARVVESDNQIQEVRSPLPGKLTRAGAGEGVKVTKGQTIFSITPDEASVWEALRALYLVGERDDLPYVEPYAKSADGSVTERVKEQAAQTVKAIRRRTP